MSKWLTSFVFSQNIGQGPELCLFCTYLSLYTCSMDYYGVLFVVQLDSGMQYIRNVVGNQFSEEDMVEVMRRCSMDAEAALNQLLERGNFFIELVSHITGTCSHCLLTG